MKRKKERKKRKRKGKEGRKKTWTNDNNIECMK